MSSTIVSSMDEKSNFNPNAFSNDQPSDEFNFVKKLLPGHRELSSSTSNPLTGTSSSSLSHAVHAALANVIQDPILAVTAGGDQCSTLVGSGDSPNSNANNNHCENCSKLRQQLTLLIYEVLNLENTMESKICEYVQRRLSEIALAEKCTNVGKKQADLGNPNESLDLSSNSSTCNYTLAQNNNHIIQENTHLNKNVNNNNNNSNQQATKYRADRTLTFENVLIGDSTLKYLDPARFDIERKTYIKTMRGKRVAQALEFIQTTRFIGTKKIMFHIGSNDLNRDKLTEQEVSEQIKELIVTTKTVSPQSEVYISLIFPRQSNEESRMKTEKLNYLLQAMASPELKVFVISHPNISHDIRGCFEDSTHLSKSKGTILFEDNIKKVMNLKKQPSISSSSQQRFNFQANKFPSTYLPLGLKLSNTNTNAANFNLNNNALVNMNMLNANALSTYLSFLVGGFRSQ